MEDVRFKESKPWWQLGEWTAADRKARAIIEDDWVINKVCIETDSRNNRVIKLTGFKWTFEYWEREEGRSRGWLQKFWIELEWACCYQSTKLICLSSLVDGSWDVDVYRDVRWTILYYNVWARSMGLGVVNELGRLGLTYTPLSSRSVVSNSFVTPRTVAARLLHPWGFKGKNTGLDFL